MKRTFKRPDGTEEVLEGTAEELAEYERTLQETSRRPPKPGVLKGSGLEEALKRIAGTLERREERDRQPYWPSGPIWITSCFTCGRIGCGGSCYRYDVYQPGVTITTTSDTIRLTDAPVQGYLTCGSSISS